MDRQNNGTIKLYSLHKGKKETARRLIGAAWQRSTKTTSKLMYQMMAHFQT